MTRVMGIDPSLTSFGIAYRGDKRITAKSVKSEPLRAYRRIAYLERHVSEAMDVCDPELVVMEGYAMGVVRGGRVFDLGEMGGVIRMLILRRGVGILCVPPTSMKLFITGTGGGKSRESKERVAQAVREICGLSFRNSDEYDAVALMLIGEAHLSPRSLPRNRKHYKRIALAGAEFLQPIAK
jgi:Holliday junction resolvasome RuvABC endonuclease subunit